MLHFFYDPEGLILDRNPTKSLINTDDMLIEAEVEIEFGIQMNSLSKIIQNH